MKYEKPERPETLMRQRANSADLLGRMSGKDPKWLDVRQFISICGAYRCWLGDYYQRKGLSNKFLKIVSATWDLRRHVAFAFGEDIYDEVFTDDHPFTTAERKAALQQHLSHLDTQIAQWYEAREVGVAV